MIAGAHTKKLDSLLPSKLLKAEITAAEREFLPAAFEVITTPPSPIRMRLMMTICVLFLLSLLISWYGKIDVYAVAQARIQPIGRSKLVQSFDAGKVRGVYVQNGAHVNAGDLLVELDPTESAADQETNARQLSSLSAEISRRTLAIETVRGNRLTPTPRIKFESIVDATTKAREQAVLDADLAELRSNVESLNSKISSTTNHKRALQNAIEEQERLVATYERRVAIWQKLQQQSLESLSSLIDAQAQLGRESTTLANQRGDLLKDDGTINELVNEIRDATSKFLADNTEELSKAQAKRDEVNQGLVKSTAKVGYTRIMAPISGTVQELVVTTIGQVVVTGQQLMTIVPTGASLEAEGLLLNKDIGFVEPGQDVVIKIDAFPFTRYGTLSGKVAHVSHDAVNNKEAEAAGYASVSDIPSQKTTSATGFAEVQNLMFPVTVTLDKSEMFIDSKTIPLSPGMSAVVEIRTEQRRVIDYILSPLVGVISEAGHER